MDAEELVVQASEEGLVYIPSERKFVSASLQAAVSKFGPKRVLSLLTPPRIKSIIDSTRTNYRNIKRICDTTQDPSYCYLAETILPSIEASLDEFENGINIEKPIRIYGIDENNKADGVLLEIYRPRDY